MGLIRIIDFETGGMEPPADVVEVGWTDLDSETGTITGGGSYLCRGAIPPDARAVHHIWPSDVADCAPFDAEDMLAAALEAGIVGLAAYSASFEAKFIGRANDGVLPLICPYKAALRIWPDAPSHSNFGLLYWLMDQGLVAPDRRQLDPAHRARPDSYATAWNLKALFAAGVTGKDMVRITGEPAMLPRCPLGKMRGKPWAEVDGGFLGWMLKQADMEPDLKWLAQVELDRRRAAQ